MLQSFFFVPANNPKFIGKSRDNGADYLVYDLEDAVLNDELDNCLENLKLAKTGKTSYVRFRFFDENNTLDESLFESLLEMGFRSFIIPKFSGRMQADIIAKYIAKSGLGHELHFGILVEDALGLLTIRETLENKIIPLSLLGLGSHDFCNNMGMRHTRQNLYFARQIILTHAKAYGLLAVDTVSVNISDEQEFTDESLDGFNMGFDGKFLIHPRQISLLKEINYYTDTEVAEAFDVYDRVMEIKDQKAAVIKINGNVYEKPHINRIINIVNWKNNYGK